MRMGEAPRFGGIWVAGSPPSRFPEGSGKTLEPKQMLSFNMHYHPSGNAGTDVSKVGLYFGTTSGEVWASTNEGGSWKCIAKHLPHIYAVEVAGVCQ